MCMADGLGRGAGGGGGSTISFDFWPYDQPSCLRMYAQWSWFASARVQLSPSAHLLRLVPLPTPSAQTSAVACAVQVRVGTTARARAQVLRSSVRGGRTQAAMGRPTTRSGWGWMRRGNRARGVRRRFIY